MTWGVSKHTLLIFYSVQLCPVCSPCVYHAGRDPGPVLGVVAEARERCIDKIEQVEETVYDDVVSFD